MEDDLSNEFPPGLLVQERSVDIVDTQSVVTLDSLPREMDVCIRLINAVLSLEEVEGNSFDARSERNFQIHLGFQSQHGRIWLWVIHDRIDKYNVGFVDDQLRDRRNRDEEAD